MKVSLSILIPTIHQKNDKGEEYLDLLVKQIQEYFYSNPMFGNGIEIKSVDNMLVNPAWNKLVAECEGDIILILNDDIIIQELVFETLATLKPGQVYCPNFSRKDQFNKIYSHNGENIVGFCFGMYKSDWQDIPSELQLWFGDNYIYEYMKHNILWGGFIHHHESKSLNNPEQKEKFDKIIEQDKTNWKSIYETIRFNS